MGIVPASCLTVFLVVWTALAIAPRYRADWLLENLPTFVAVPAVVGYRRFRFSSRAYVQATIFLILHTIGSHYTYSEVPVGDWMRDLFGLTRNHFDRVVHLAFGLLMLRPVREIGFRSRAAPGRFAVLYFSVAGVACWSLVYEVVEWLVASVADPAAGTAYLGTQGDVWDAQKDMALALAGAAIAVLVEWWLDPPGAVQIVQPVRASLAADPSHRARRPTRHRPEDTLRTEHDSEAQVRTLPPLLAIARSQDPEAPEPRHLRDARAGRATRTRSAILQASRTARAMLMRS